MCPGGKWNHEEKTGGVKMEKERKFKSEMKEAWEAAGWRERFAVDNAYIV